MTSMIDFCADIQISDCMNDIINQVETREWNRVNEHRDRLVKKMKKQKATIEEMKDDWEVATEKIGQESSDLDNEIKKLKNEKIHIQTMYNARYLKYENEIKELKNEMKLLKDLNKSHLQRLEHMEKSKSGIRYKELLDENEKLKSSLMNSSGSFKCEKCNIHLTEDDVYMSVDECEGKLLCESCWEED